MSEIIIMSDVGRSNHNGRTYPRDVVERALVEYAGKRVKLGFLRNVTEEAERVPAFMMDNVRMDGDKVVANMSILQTPAGEELRKIMAYVEAGAQYNLAFRTNGVGAIENGVVTDYRMEDVSIEIVPRPAVSSE